MRAGRSNPLDEAASGRHFGGASSSSATEGIARDPNFHARSYSAGTAQDHRIDIDDLHPDCCDYAVAKCGAGWRDFRRRHRMASFLLPPCCGLAVAVVSGACAAAAHLSGKEGATTGFAVVSGLVGGTSLLACCIHILASCYEQAALPG